MVMTAAELETPRPSHSPILDHFSLLPEEEILLLVRTTSCPLDLCPSWLIKASVDSIQAPVGKIINLSLSSGTFPGILEEAVVIPLGPFGSG